MGFFSYFFDRSCSSVILFVILRYFSRLIVWVFFVGFVFVYFVVMMDDWRREIRWFVFRVFEVRLVFVRFIEELGRNFAFVGKS